MPELVLCLALPISAIIGTHLCCAVPAEVPYDVFWERYFYRLHQLQADDARRAALVRSMSNAIRVRVTNGTNAERHRAEVASHAHAEESFDWNLDDEDDASSAVEVTAESVAALEAGAEKPVPLQSTTSAPQADVDGAMLPSSIPVHQEVVTASPEIEADAPRGVSPRKIQPEAEATSAEGSALTTTVTTTDEEQAIQLPQDDADAWEWE